AQEHEDTRELRERSPLLQALAGLSDGDREVLLLAAWDGLSTAEVGAVLDCSRPAAKVRLHRAKRRLRAELERLDHSALPQAPTRRLEECP
ncbi:MAG TPA: sigma-70 family RNA polymerase sigma factor, partial [Thermoleophilaceae bacterium]|nr:sigma-70 family RNA polymerase sigma factor [Thermoleophilaceae bacterium]